MAARIGKQFEAPFRFERPCNRDVFNGWLARQLCPLLGEDHIVVMDNVPFHKGKNTADLIHRTGATLLFLPPYSPALKLIEHDFAVLKKRPEYAQDETLDNIIKTYK